MLTRLSRAFLRVFPAVLLLVVGLLTALFRKRRDPREGATMLVPVPVPVRPRERPARRSGTAIAILAVLLGIGGVLIVLGGDGTLRRLVSPPSSSDGGGGRPVAALSQADVDYGRQGTSKAAPPNGSNASAEPGGRGAATESGKADTTAPTFDTVRVEPNGELVVAGRAAPNGSVELLVDGKSTASVVADANGQFAIVPPALPKGNSEVGLRVTDGKGAVSLSRDSVAVAVSPSHDAKPLVALTSPDKPTVVLSQPGSARTATGSLPNAEPAQRTMAVPSPLTQQSSNAVSPVDSASNAVTARDAALSSLTRDGGNAVAGATDGSASVRAGSGSTGTQELTSSREGAANRGDGAPTKIVSVDAQEGGRLFVTGQAATGATVRLYLNDTLIAPARVGRDGSVTFTIGRGVKPGDYKVRLDEVDAASGKVRSRVEVPFSVPDAARMAGTDRSLAAPSEGSSTGYGGGKARSQASPPMASSSETVARQAPAGGASDGPRDFLSKSPVPPASVETLRDPLKGGANPAVVFVPEVKTARIERGDSLWAISRRTYGEGDRYTAIYDANQDQIRDPDLIYPGQVFVLPSEDAINAVGAGKRG